MVINTAITCQPSSVRAHRAASQAAPEEGPAPSDRVRLQHLQPLETPRKAVDTLAEGFGYAEFPQVSPDGKTLTFNVVGDYATSQMLVMSSRGGTVRDLATGRTVTPETIKDVLTATQGQIWEQASWADERHLLYRSNEQGTFGIGRFDVKTREREMLIHDPNLNMKHPVELDDGRILCYGGPPSDQYPTVDKFSNLFIADPATGQSTMLTDSTGDVAYKHPSVMDGYLLAHKEDKRAGGIAEIVRLAPEGGGEVNLTQTADADERHPFYNEEVDLLVYHRKEDGDKNLVLSTPDGSRTAQLTFYGKPAQSPCWSPDGRKIYFIKKGTKPEGMQHFYERPTEVRVLDVKKALKDLVKQATERLESLEASDAPADLVELAREQRDTYRSFLARY